MPTTNRNLPETFPQAAVSGLKDLESFHARAHSLHLEYSKLQHRFPEHRRALVQHTPQATYQTICEQRIATLPRNGRSFLNWLKKSRWQLREQDLDAEFLDSWLSTNLLGNLKKIVLNTSAPFQEAAEESRKTQKQRRGRSRHTTLPRDIEHALEVLQVRYPLPPKQPPSLATEGEAPRDSPSLSIALEYPYTRVDDRTSPTSSPLLDERSLGPTFPLSGIERYRIGDNTVSPHIGRGESATPSVLSTFSHLNYFQLPLDDQTNEVEDESEGFGFQYSDFDHIDPITTMGPANNSNGTNDDKANCKRKRKRTRLSDASYVEMDEEEFNVLTKTFDRVMVTDLRSALEGFLKYMRVRQTARDQTAADQAELQIAATETGSVRTKIKTQLNISHQPTTASLATELATTTVAIANGNSIIAAANNLAATSCSRYKDMLTVNPNINRMLDEDNKRKTGLEEAIQNLTLLETKEQEKKAAVERAEAREDRLGGVFRDFTKLLRAMIELDTEDARVLLQIVGEDRAVLEEESDSAQT